MREVHKGIFGNHLEGRRGLCQDLQQMPEVQQYYWATNRRTDSDNDPMAVYSIGIKHYGTISYNGTIAEVPGSRH